MKHTYRILSMLVVLACILAAFAPQPTKAATRLGLSSDESQNEAVVLRFLYEGLNERNFAVLNEVLAPTFISHNPFGTSTGIPAFEKVAGALVAAFPDVHISVLEVVAAGDTVVVRDLTTATQKGTFFGIPATGKKVSWSEYQFWHLSQGKIVEQYVTFDTLALVNQLKGS